MVEVTDCLARQLAPSLNHGDIVKAGEFYRNLTKGDISKRFKNDRDDSPTWGYRLRPDKWRWRDADGVEGLSVNLATCARSAACSICLHRDPAIFAHVAEIKVEALSKALKCELVAVYSPEEPNRCHFDILPLNVSIDRLIEALVVLGRTPAPGKMPSGDDVGETQRQVEVLDACMRLHLNAWPCDYVTEG